MARRYDVNTNLVFTWRRRYDKSQDVPPPQLLPVMVTPDQPVTASARSVFDGVEIDMPGGYRVRCGRGVKIPRHSLGAGLAGTAMIAFPSSVRVWLAVGRTDMRRGMNGLALQVQEALGRDPMPAIFTCSEVLAATS